jgi:subtilisin family serine protease
VKRLALATVVAAHAAPAAAQAFTPNDPLAPRQWYLTQIGAFDAWPDVPVLAPVRVAVVDSGIDGAHPEFAGRVVASKSFVGGTPLVDTQGHGTFVAGIVAAATNNATGIAGIAFPAQLLIAKVVTADGDIPVSAEAAAIRWAANHGARVINLSLGGVRDPLNTRRDEFSTVEAAAVRYAYKKGAVVVAAVGNGDRAPSEPWPYASYPAALPHVLGVSALTRTGNVPVFSNRDQIYNDLAAPGDDIFSTFPRPLTQQRATCADQGYSDCAPPAFDDYRHAEGTSFAAPQAAAAATLVLATNPALRPDQVMQLLEHTATDVTPASGCKQCRVLRDALSGWGRLDVAAAVHAVSAPLPPADRLEPNDDAGTQAPRISATAKLHATLDFWDDQIDVYRVRIPAGKRLLVRTDGPAGTNTDLLLWRPGTKHVADLRAQRLRVAQSLTPGASERLSYRAKKAGTYYVELKLASAGSGSYTLSLSTR